MRQPLSMLLYAVAACLFGWSAWSIYELLPRMKREVRESASNTGINQGRDLLARGKGQGPASADWRFTRQSAPWWATLKEVNLIGKLPPPPPEARDPAKEIAVEVKLDRRPLEQIIELVSLVYDGSTAGRGGETHVVVRYKPEANVEPPEWWIRENTIPVAGAGAPAGLPRDLAAAPRPAPTSRPAGAGQPAGRPAAAPTPMPSSVSGREMLQKIWLDGSDTPRRGARLWPPFAHIRLVRVAADAQSAFFVRESAAGKGEEPSPPLAEEELLKTAMNLSQDVLQELRRLQGREGQRLAAAAAPDAPPATGVWREVEETTRFGNAFHIGRQDEQRFRQGGDDFLERVHVDTYVGREGRLSGLSVRSVEPKLATSFGVAVGDVLLEINGRKVESRAQTINMVRRDYDRGVRTFATRWLSNGQIVERTYQAPDR